LGHHFVTSKRRAVVLATLVLLATLSSSVIAQPSAAPENAAKQWLSLLDGGKYNESWNQAGSFFKARISAQIWHSKVMPVRRPLGAVKSRKAKTVTLSHSLPGVPDGQYAVVRFNSVFAHKTSAIETVTLDKKNKNWAVIGYFIK
jgi:hypothetical protein